MTKPFLLSIIPFLLLAILATGCSGLAPAAGQSKPVPTEGNPSSGQAETGFLERTDAQGAVTILVTPLNLKDPGKTVDFNVRLETHSVDLRMDLATLATLSTDTGRSVQAVHWDAPVGGHHVSGTLSFPAEVDGQPILEGASKLTLTIKDLDAPQRVLTWDISQ